MRAYDKQYWLSEETRIIPLPGGGNGRFTMMRIYWGAYDALIREHNFTSEKLIDLCMEEAIASGRKFDRVFPDCLAYLDRELGRIKKRYAQPRRHANTHAGPVSKVQIERLEGEIRRLEANRPKIPD